ncbi:unnamed protein product [Thelazia callipaeda]|uniref:Ovule protein n=1 Tax=Thelazia callipaeda TaxID=103827 RepID=A0A0N5CJX0_THECL|nr:unnamed protein product [Thelazia callipaeda]
MNLILAFKRDCHEALSMLTKLVRVYESKIKTNDSDAHWKSKTSDLICSESSFIGNEPRNILSKCGNKKSQRILDHDVKKNSKVGDNDSRHNEYLEEFVSEHEVHDLEQIPTSPSEN